MTDSTSYADLIPWRFIMITRSLMMTLRALVMGSVLIVLLFPTPGRSQNSNKGKIPMGFVTVNIENQSNRPMSVNCWSDVGELERESELDPKTEFEFRFAKHSHIMWDCTVMSIDDSGNMKYLSNAISKTFRAWINNDYPPHVTQALHSAMNAPSMSPVLGLCDRCRWKLTKTGISLMEGNPGDTNRDRYNFAFLWDTRGHKRRGDRMEPLYLKRIVQSSHKVEIDHNTGVEKYFYTTTSKLKEDRTHKVQTDQSKRLTDLLNGREDHHQNIEAERRKWKKNPLENGDSKRKVEHTHKVEVHHRKGSNLNLDKSGTEEGTHMAELDHRDLIKNHFDPKQTKERIHRVDVDSHEKRMDIRDAEFDHCNWSNNQFDRKQTETCRHRVEVDRQEEEDIRDAEVDHSELSQDQFVRKQTEAYVQRVVDEETDIRDVQGQIGRSVNKKMNAEL